MLQTRREKLPTTVTGRCRRCLQQNNGCALYPSTRLHYIEQFATQSVLLSTSSDSQAAQIQHGTPLFYGDGKERTLETDSSLETETSAAFSMGFNEANHCEFTEIITPPFCLTHFHSLYPFFFSFFFFLSFSSSVG
jgi:hypothetical protein